MEGLHEALNFATVFALAALAGVSAKYTQGAGAPAGRRATAIFALLSGVLLVLSVTPEGQQAPSLLGFQKAATAALVFFPYLMFRFALTFSSASQRLKNFALVGTIVVSALSFLVPSPLANGQEWSSARILYFAAFSAQWVGLSLFAAHRLWTAGTHQPGIARRRMRMMTIASIALNLAILASAAGSDDPVDLSDLLGQIFLLLAASTFYMALVPPRWLRQVWMRPEQEHLKRALVRVMNVSTAEEVGETLLPSVAAVVGAHAAAISDADKLVRMEYRVSDQMHADLRPTPRGSSGELVWHRINLGGGPISLVVWSSPLAPPFGPDELDLLRMLTAVIELSIERASLLAAEEMGRSQLEARKADLETTNEYLAKEIADRKQAEADMRAAREEADRANRAKSEFLSRMSHELRTPLNSILGFGQLLKSDGITPDQRESVGQILRAGEHLLELINEILDISRIEAGRIGFRFERVEVPGVINTVLDLMRPMAQTRKVSLNYYGGETEPPAIVADPQRIKQVLLNLTSNAIKYGRTGGRVEISTQTFEDTLRVSVTDEGEGLSREKQDQLFIPFERLNQEHGTTEGTGLGLALSKRLVELMGGSIGVESEPGYGSAFWVELPIDFSGASEAGGTDLGEGERKILCIGQDSADRSLLERVLSAVSGVRVFMAGDGLSGLDVARKVRPDLILLDVSIPDIDPEAFLEEPLIKNIPVIAISSDTEGAEMDRLLAAGAAGNLKKPIVVQRLMRAVETVLGFEVSER